MCEDWKTYKLGELTTKIGSGATPKGGKEAYQDSGISLIRSQNVLDFTFSTDGLAFINEDQARALNNVTVESRDVLLNITGDSVARVCQVPDKWLPARVNQHVAIIRANQKELSPEYLKYTLLTKANKNILLTLAGAGATRNALTKSMIEDFEISIPSLKEQIAIASILSALDEKIELNLQMNKTLEEMTMCMYKNWFEDFGPFQEGEFVESELGMIPTGWEVSPFDSMLVLQRGFDLPENKRINGVYPVFAASGRSTYHCEKKVDGPGVTTGRSGVLGKVFFINEDFWPLNTTLWVKEYPNSSPYHAYFLLSSLDLKEFNSGSAVPTLNRNDVHRQKIVKPPLAIIRNFDHEVKEMFDLQFSNYTDNKTLTTLRDILLPKLISGEVRVKEAEKILEEVM